MPELQIEDFSKQKTKHEKLPTKLKMEFSSQNCTWVFIQFPVDFGNIIIFCAFYAGVNVCICNKHIKE